MLAELLATDGVEERLELRSRIGLLALHGGSLEAMTDTIAARASDVAGASFYAIRQPRHLRWHIPSNRMDPSEAPALRRFLEHVDVVIAVHGWGTDGFMQDPGPREHEHPILLGGGNRRIACALAERLRSALPDYRFVDDLDAMPQRIRGLHPRNPVNMCRDGGVQIELTPRIRGLPPFWIEPHRGPDCPDTRTLVDTLGRFAGELA